MSFMDDQQGLDPIEDDETGPAEASTGDQGSLPREVPRPDRLEKKWFSIGWEREPSLAITVADEQIRGHGAQAGLTGRLLTKIDEVLEQFGGLRPVVAGALPLKSITIFLDDPPSATAQEAIPVEYTLNAASRVKRLMELDGDELFAAAIDIGPKASSYVELLHVVETSGATLRWKPRGEDEVELDVGRARRQHARLSVEPELRQELMTLEGVLYRVIADPSKSEGSIGIKLARKSSRPSWQRGSWAKVIFDRNALEATIKDGLIGESVVAQVRLIEPVPGTGLSTEARRLELISINQRASSLSLDDLIDETEDEAGMED